MLWKTFRLIFNFLHWISIHPIMCFIASRTDFLHWRRLLSLRFAVNPFMPRENSFYGHHRAVRGLGISPYCANIEHGVYFADSSERVLWQISKLQRMLFRVKRVITFGSHRARFIRNVIKSQQLDDKVSVVQVGPYILGAKPFLSETELASFRERFGRVLLVFPIHSIEATKIDYDINRLIGHIEKVRSSFDTVVISMYWHDLVTGAWKAYAGKGYEIVCSGRREDPYFLSRQKSLFQLASAVLSNGVGTHVGYSVAMGIPCWLFDGQGRYTAKNERESDSLDKFRDVVRGWDFYSAFPIGGQITDRQRALVREWWGEAK